MYQNSIWKNGLFLIVALFILKGNLFSQQDKKKLISYSQSVLGANESESPITNYIPDLEIPNTLMYKANQQWAQKLVDEGFEIIDIGYPSNVSSPSIFYNMELNIIF